MPRLLQYSFAAFILVLLIGGPLAYAHHQHNRLRNFHVVRDGVLYRSGQLSLEGLQRVVHDYRIKTVVTLRYAQRPGDRPPDLAEEEYCKTEEINHFRLVQKEWEAPDGTVPNEVAVAKFREIMDNPANYPVLVHCLAGKHRTGAMCAVFRMEHDRWSNEQAMEEMKLYGYDNLREHNDLLGYLARYRPTWTTAGPPAGTTGGK
jgi:tyrosine-protein phosphatase SIW14